jgi:hypothetical protein
LDVGLPSWSWVGWELSHSVNFHRIETTEDDSYIPPLTIWHHDLQLCVNYPKRHVDPLPSLLNNFSRPFAPDIQDRDDIYITIANPFPSQTNNRAQTNYRRHAEIERGTFAAQGSSRNSESVASSLREGVSFASSISSDLRPYIQAQNFIRYLSRTAVSIRVLRT